MIEKLSKSKFALYSKKTGKLLGIHPTLEAAKRQEAAIEISKAQKSKPAAPKKANA